MSSQTPPIILCLSGHDPTGGAGLHADIEAIAAAGCHPASAITCLTVQDTHDVHRLIPAEPKLFRQQAKTILHDLPVAAIKIGLMGDYDICKEIAALAREHPHIPVILDPVLAAGGGTELAGKALLESIRQDLLPQVDLAIPNSLEARRISGKTDLAEAAARMLAMGCKNVLITGAHEESTQVSNTLYRESVADTHTLEWPRLPHSYHGSGCTLASAIAARIALGLPLIQAVTKAQEYTWRTLKQAHSFSSAQAIPNRFPEHS